VFEGAQSEEAQVRALIDRARDEFNDHDWNDFLALCDLTAEEREAWRQAIPRQASLASIESLQPLALLSVPPGATEYEVDVNVIASLNNPLTGKSLQSESMNGRLYLVKVDGRWRIDLDRSAPSFPYVPRPSARR